MQDDESTQRATLAKRGPSPRVAATTSGGYAEEQHSSRVLSQPIFVRHHVGTYTFCVFCFLFAKHQLSLGQLTLQEHSKQNVHLMASMDVVDLMERGSLSVQHILRDQASALVKSNRLKLHSQNNCVLW